MAKRVFIGEIDGPLKGGAVNVAHGTGVPAAEDRHAVAPLEAVVVVHTGNVVSGHTARQ